MLQTQFTNLCVQLGRWAQQASMHTKFIIGNINVPTLRHTNFLSPDLQNK